MAALGQEDTVEFWLNKATDPESQAEDWESIQRLCDLVNVDSEGGRIASRLLAHKIQSPQELEALRALTVLETCINNCGNSFHQEVGKFRFLNELIKVLSPKYLGAWSTDQVKERITEILYSWTVWFPEELKIQNAYQMLKKNGIIKKDPKLPRDKLLPPPSPRPKDSIFDDEEKSQLLARLLKSSQSEDLKAANRLIKSLIKEEQEKAEKVSRRTAAIAKVKSQTQLLAQMLSRYQREELPPGDWQAMQSLYERCQKLRPTLFRLASDTVDDDEALAEVLRGNDILTQALAQYQQIVGGTDDGRSLAAAPPDSGNSPAPVTPDSEWSLRLIDLSALGTAERPGRGREGPQLSSTPSVCLLEGDFQSLELSDSPTFQMASPDLGPAQPVLQNGFPFAQNAPHCRAMEGAGAPAPNSDTGRDFTGGFVTSSSKPHRSPPSHLQLRDLSAAKASLRLPDRSAHYVEMQPLVKMSPARTGGSHQQWTDPALPPPTDLDASLASLFVPLESIKPSCIGPVTVYDKNGLKIMLHVSSETVPGRPEVNVLVLSMLSTAPQPIQDIVFQAAVPKAMRVKLQPPSSSELPPFNPLLPPAVISQVLLLLNPQKDRLRLRYKLTFSQAGQAFSEVGEIHGTSDSTVWGRF